MYDEQTRYSEFIRIPEGFVPNMTREDINASEDRWLDFYPHESYLKLLNVLVGKFHGRKGTTSLWITGSYGTGKTNAALVTQKLFQEKEKDRTDWWFEHHDGVIPSAYKGLRKEIEKCREEKTLVVYDYDGSNLGPGREFIVRMEKSVIKALEEEGYEIPVGAKFDKIAERVRREGHRVIEIRDAICRESSRVFHDKVMTMGSADELADAILNADPSDPESIGFVRDAEWILQKDDIYINPDASGFIEWIGEVRKINGIARVVYIFDEFSDFIETNKKSLKTFEDVSEKPHNSGFYFVPVTHMDLKSFHAENSESAGKAKNRFDFESLSMPDNIAFELMSHAMGQNVPEELKDEWEGIKDELWVDIEKVADELDNGTDRRAEDFRGILPVHPMAGLLLKTLSDVVGSNQRSIFEYLKEDSLEGTFSKFIKDGGPLVDGKEVLTTDYLWSYFIEREDPTAAKEVRSTRAYYEKMRYSPALRDKEDDDPQLRVFRTALLFILLSDLSKGGVDGFLMPTQHNIELAYKGFSGIGNVGERLSRLKEASCITLSPSGTVLKFESTIDDDKVREKAKEIGDNFGKAIARVTEDKLNSHMRSKISNYPPSRFDVKVSEGKVFSRSMFTDKDRFLSGGEDDVGGIRLWFLISKNHEDNREAIARIDGFLEDVGKEHRVVVFYFKDATFCSSDDKEWDEYAECKARDLMTGSQRDAFSKELKRYEEKWTGKLTMDNAEMVACYFDGEVRNTDLTWAKFNTFIKQRVNKFFPMGIDHLIDSPQNALKTSSFANCANLGMTLETKDSGLKRIADQLRNAGLTTEESWFKDNPGHPLSMIHEGISFKIKEEIAHKGYFSLNSAFWELRKSPYGLQPVGMTAIVLGFCLKDTLDGRYQWTDNKVTDELNQKILAEIIENAVKGNDPKQKYICETSDEEREFYDKAPRLFGVEKSGDTLNGTVNLITSRIRDESGKAPLWTLKGYIEGKDDPFKADIISILDDISLILSVSSKKPEGRIEAVRRIGGKLLESPGLVEEVSKYTDKTTFRLAFRQYLDRSELISERAAKIGDTGGKYVDAVLDKMSVSSSYLWKDVNTDDSISEVAAEYGIIAAVKSIKSIDTHIDYLYAKGVLEESIENALPVELVRNEFPRLANYKNKVEKLKDNNPAGVLEDICTYLVDNKDELRSVYFDTSLESTAEILKKSYSGSMRSLDGLSDDDIKAAFRRIGQPGKMTADGFRRCFEEKVGEVRRESAEVKLMGVWMEKTGTKDPSEWEDRYRMPSRYAFPGDGLEGLSSVVEKPRDFSSERLESVSEMLMGQNPPDISGCQSAFMDKVVPPSYRGIGLNFAGVTDYLHDKYGRPGEWPSDIDISGMVHDTYSKFVEPVIHDRIVRMDPVALKEIILRAIGENEDLGIQLSCVTENDTID